ncbi:hypothetical protein CSUI_007827 [Cystoisospora suis]|uniref:Transmembrane protein n=1 Tax=Cystoisospora suis TaxID=483139 RepID=A0A2C6KPP9_9APIC|nr:hypothetical protein CSUI_007827 [Cystoisospora suis]
MDSSEFATRGEREEGGGMAFHPASSNAPLTAVEEIWDQLKRESISGSRVSRRESSSRSSGRRVDSSGVRGLLRVARGAAVVGMLLISVAAFRFVICLAASRLYRGSPQDMSGTAPRALSGEETPLLAATSAGALTGEYGTLDAACFGYPDNPTSGPGVESFQLLPPSGGLGDLPEPGHTGNRRPRSPRTGVARLRAQLKIASVLLFVFVVAVGVSLAVAAAVSKQNFLLAYALAGAVFALAVPFYLLLRRTPSFRSSHANQAVSSDVLRL